MIAAFVRLDLPCLLTHLHWSRISVALSGNERGFINKVDVDGCAAFAALLKIKPLHTR